MMKIEEIIEALRGRNIKDVARATGLHYNTIYSIVNGKKKNPMYNVILRLSSYIKDGHEGTTL